MPTKDFYGLLGVQPDADSAEIRKAYIRISRVIHPDRFDPQKQKEDWEQANRMLSEVNEAWQTLKDPQKRERYDVQKGFSTPRSAFSTEDLFSGFTYQQQPQSAPDPRDYGPDPTRELKSGQSPFTLLPSALQKSLLRRQRGEEEDQYYINTDQPAHHYLKTGLILLWIAILGFSALGREWSTGLSLFFGIATLLITIYFSRHLFWLIRWNRSPLLSRLYITPLYIIETNLGLVRWWPVTGIEDIRITSGKKYYSARDTFLKLKYASETVQLNIVPIQLARNCVHMIQQYRSQVDQAMAEYDYDYVRSSDDFKHAQTHLPEDYSKTKYASYGIPALIMMVAFGFLFSENRGNEPQIGSRIISQMLPHNGSQVNYFDGEARAPLELHAEKHRHFLVRIKHEQSGFPVKTVFVRSGNSVSTRLPDGEFTISYAAGNYWYGSEDMFGPRGSFYRDTRVYSFGSSGNELSGHLINLADSIRLASGEILEIDANEFQSKNRY